MKLSLSTHILEEHATNIACFLFTYHQIVICGSDCQYSGVDDLVLTDGSSVRLVHEEWWLVVSANIHKSLNGSYPLWHTLV